MIQISLDKKLKAANGEMRLHIDIEIEQGELITLYGNSGAGKTSILRMIAGLLPADKGLIIVNQQTWLNSQKGICLKPQQRKIGFVFQDYALFQNMAVKDNLVFALEKGQNKRIVNELIS